MLTNPEILLRKALIVSAMVFPMVFAGCQKDKGKENSPPTASLYVTPTSGDIPLEVRVQVGGTDPDGTISKYKLNVSGQGSSEQSTPIDKKITFTAEGSYTISGSVVDNDGASGSANPVTVVASSKPFIDQTATLVNDVELYYSATLSKVASAKLTVNRDGVLLFTKDITDGSTSGVDFGQLFNYALNGVTKGSYEFILKSDNFEKRTTVIIPNYSPTLNLSGINMDVVEDSSKTVILPITAQNPVDKNPEDNPVPIVGVKSVEGKTLPTLNGTNLKIKSLSNPNGTYQAPYFLGSYGVELELGNSATGITKLNIPGTINLDSRLKVNGFLTPAYSFVLGKDTTLNFYGSGDADKNNIINAADVARIIEIYNGTYTNPNDKRLLDRADVNGDGFVNILDNLLLSNYVNGSIPYLPGQWNKLPTKAE